MKTARFDEITGHYNRLKIAVVGDYSLDRYLEIDPARREISIETNLPVHNVVNVRSQPGAAGTILNNLVALGCKAVIPVGFCGTDGEGYELQRALRTRGLQVPLQHFVATDQRRTFTYCKPLLLHPGKPPEELSRLDTKNWSHTPAEVENRIIDSIRKLANEVHAFIVLDQVDEAGTGVVTENVRQALGELQAAEPELLILADSRRGLKDWPPLTFKMNANELARLAELPTPVPLPQIPSLAATFARHSQQKVIVTLSENGMLAADPHGNTEQVPCFPLRGPIDIVGAGDSVTANLTTAFASGANLKEAIQLANTAASIVIHQLGTTGTATVEQIRELLFGSTFVA